MSHTETTETVERLMQEANRRLSNLEHTVLEAGEADVFLNWLRTALTTIRKETLEEVARWSETNANGVDQRNRCWVELPDLRAHLQILKK